MSTHHDTAQPAYPLADAARLLLSAGLSVIPIRDLAAKAPAVSTWMPYRQAPATPLVAQRWFTDNGHPGAPGIAIIGGDVSGGLTVLDFDVHDGEIRYDAFADACEEMAPGLICRLPLVATPSGGRHLYFRCPDVEGNERLAETAAHNVLIETRGEGGYVVAPPTPGYAILRGTVRAIPSISSEERAVLLQTARALGELPHLREGAAHMTAAAARPGDAYNAQVGATQLAGLLGGHGWTTIAVRAGRLHLRRPGKDSGVSATITADQGMAIFYPFTSSTSFEPNRGYSPFGVYAQLVHGGDYQAAAAALAAQGYGAPARAAGSDPRPPATDPTPASVAPGRKVVIPTARELLAQEFPALREIIPGLIVEGHTLFAAAPKAGKTITAEHLAIAVASGGYALGTIKCQQGRAAYIALEDGPRRCRDRIRELLHGAECPEQLHICTEWRRLDDGGLEDLDAWLTDNPDTRLVVIDTLQRVRPRETGTQRLFTVDYEAAAPLTDLAHKHHVAIISNVHTRKMAADDVLDMISGTQGLAAAVDAILVLQRARFGTDGVISVMGRDVEERAYAVSWDRDLRQWKLEGNAEDYARSKEQNAVLGVLTRARRVLGIQEIADRVGRAANSSLRMLLSRLVEAGLAVSPQRGQYRAAQPKAAEKEHVPVCHFVTPDDAYEKPIPLFPQLPCQEEGDEAPHTRIDRCDKVTNALPCPSCSRRMWAPAPYNPELIICRNCGRTQPEQEEHDDDA